MIFHGLDIVILCCLLPYSLSGATWQQEAGFRYVDVSSEKSLSANSPTPRKAGFTQMPSSLTGIGFSNSIPAIRFMENNNYMLGSGVAAGDFDGDGWCDLYLCSLNGANVLYRNRGGWRFEDVTAAVGVAGDRWKSTGCAFADIDGDGDLDLLVSTLGTGVHVLINNGLGRFMDVTAKSGLAAQTGSTSMALGDVDGDSDLDLFVANYGAHSILRSGGKAEMKMVNGKWMVQGPYANRLRYANGKLEELGEPSVLYINDGRGRFSPVPWGSEWFLDEQGQPRQAPWDFSLTVQMRDIDDDGDPDLYINNDFQTVDRIWLNDGNGHFRAIPRLAIRKQSFSSMSVDFADIDRDGFYDFFVTEMMSRKHADRIREMSGLAPLVPMPGRIDNRPEVVRNTLYWNRGDNTYAEIANFSGVASTDWSWTQAFIDVDLDGYEDLLVGNGVPYDVQDRDTLDRIRALGRQSVGESRTNLALYPPLLTPNVAFRNRGDLTFTDSSSDWGFDSRDISTAMALADLDSDGDMDVVVNCINSQALIYRNDSTAPRVAVRMKGSGANPFGIGAQVRLLGGAVPLQSQEILSGGRYLSSDEPMRFFAAGSSTNRMSLEVRWRNGRQSRVEDVQANRIYEIDQGKAVAHSKEPKPAPSARWFNDISDQLSHTNREDFFNDYVRQPLIMRHFSQLGPGIAWWDLDGDGSEELILGANKSNSVAIYQLNGSNELKKAAVSSWKALDDMAGLTGWTWANGRPSVLAGIASYENDYKTGSSLVEISWIPVQREFQAVPIAGLPHLPESIGPLAAADMDADGNLELFVGGRIQPGAYPAPVNSYLFRQVNGRLVLDARNQKILEKIGLVSGAAWGDLDMDGFPELIVACEWGPVRIFHNNRGQLREQTAALGLDQHTGWWTGIATGDFDEDGRLDFVAGNWGLNDAYTASPRSPLKLYYGDLGGAGVMDLFESYYPPELHVDVPRRSLNALRQAVPALSERFPTHQAFSQASMADVLAAIPAKPRCVQATTLATSLFLNRGSRFEVIPLPAEAQWAPVFGLTVIDGDGDGHDDLFLSQNFFATRPEWPRLDGGRGLILRGNGTGPWLAVPGRESGILVYGEQRGMASADFNRDGRPDLVIMQNGTATCLLENTRANVGLRVRLQGQKGNPHAIGAMVRLQTNSRWGPLRSVNGGAGYWSQDSPQLVLGLASPPQRIRVHWPGGKTNEFAVAPSSRIITVTTNGVAP